MSEEKFIKLKMVAICEKCGTMYDPAQLYKFIPDYNPFKSNLPCCGGKINNTANGETIDAALNKIYANKGE